MEATKASVCLYPDKEVIEGLNDAASLSTLQNSRTPGRANRSYDLFDRPKAESRSAYRFVRRFVEPVRREIRCYCVRLLALRAEENVFDGRVVVVNKRRSGDSSPLVLCIPLS